MITTETYNSVKICLKKIMQPNISDRKTHEVRIENRSTTQRITQQTYT